MARQKLKEFYEPEEITPEMLNGIVDETNLRPRQILGFVELVEHDTAMIELDVFIQQVERFANIVGFSDSSIKLEGVKLETKLVSPFHVKGYHSFKLTESKEIQKSGNSVTITAAGLATSTAMQEEGRMNLLHWSVLAMINDRQFTYNNGDLLISVPFTAEIGTLTAPAAKLDTAGFANAEIQKMKNEYFRTNKQVPNLAFMSHLTAAKFIAIPEVAASFIALQSSDPENSDQLFHQFSYNGILWVVLHEQYPALDGTLQDPINEGRIIMTVQTVIDPNPDTAGEPFKMHRASNQLNGENPARPFYDIFDVSNDPVEVGHRLYDNWIPGVAKRDIVMHWEAISV